MVTALETLHSTGYVHNDIKPENIMLDIDDIDDSSEYHATLIDYGFASRFLNREKKHI